MNKHFDDFLTAIESKHLLSITFEAKEKGIIKRTCVPFDFGPSKRNKDGLDRFHFLDLDSPDGKHNLSILPEQIIEIEIQDKEFNPSNYITWTPNWIIKRDWGIYS